MFKNDSLVHAAAIEEETYQEANEKVLEED